MSTKLLTLSSGLKNISLNKFTDEDYFFLIFGDQEYRMNRIFAEFISPTISHLHHSDPTIQDIKFDDLYYNETNDFKQFAHQIFTDDTFSLLYQISSGFSIEIDENQAFKLRFLSIILGNEELFKRINELFPPEFSAENIETYIEHILSCYYFSRFLSDFDFSNLIDYISKNFYSIDPYKFLKLPLSIQYSIISNPHLQVQSEDS